MMEWHAAASSSVQQQLLLEPWDRNSIRLVLLVWLLLYKFVNQSEKRNCFHYYYYRRRVDSELLLQEHHMC